MKLIMENWKRFLAEEKPLMREFVTLGGALSSPAAIEQSNNINDIAIAELAKVIQKMLPLHIRGFARFLLGITREVDVEFLSEKEVEALRKAALYLRAHKTRGKKRISYGVWRKLSKSSLGKKYKEYTSQELKLMKARGEIPLSQKADLLEQEEFSSFSRFLGAATVQKVGNNFVFVDHYDFNDAKSKKTFDQLMSDLAKVVEGDAYSAIRRLAPWRQIAGYKGYPVKIVIPIES